jgi:hypothetical protein
VPFDHRDRRAHHLRQLEHGHACGECVRGERRAQVVNARWLRDARRVDGGRPYATAEVIEVQRTALGAWEEERDIEAGGQAASCSVRVITPGMRGPACPVSGTSSSSARWRRRSFAQVVIGSGGRRRTLIAPASLSAARRGVRIASPRYPGRAHPRSRPGRLERALTPPRAAIEASLAAPASPGLSSARCCVRGMRQAFSRTLSALARLPHGRRPRRDLLPGLRGTRVRAAPLGSRSVPHGSSISGVMVRRLRNWWQRRRLERLEHDFGSLSKDEQAAVRANQQARGPVHQGSRLPPSSR